MSKRRSKTQLKSATADKGLTSKYFSPPKRSRHFVGVDVPSLASVTPRFELDTKSANPQVAKGETETEIYESDEEEKQKFKRLPRYMRKWMKAEIVTQKAYENGVGKIVHVNVHKDRTVPMPFRLLAVKPLLIQHLFFTSPEWVLIATILLNKTAGTTALPVFDKIRKLWPDMKALAQADHHTLLELLRPLGLYQVRAKRLIDFAKMWIENPPSPERLHKSRVTGKVDYPRTPVSHLPGMGRYALDSYRIFCSPTRDEDYVLIRPEDKELRLYMRWLFATNGFVWDCRRGIVGPTTEDYLHALCEGRLDPACNADGWH